MFNKNPAAAGFPSGHTEGFFLHLSVYFFTLSGVVGCRKKLSSNPLQFGRD
jgi:hypothetical protein